MPTGPNSQKNTPARRRANAKYAAKPEQKKRRAARTKARRQAVRDGRVKKGDGKDVHHKDGNPLNNKKSNIAVTSKKANRTLKRDKNARKRKKNGK